VAAPIERFRLTGEPARYIKVAQSGNRRAQMFCPTCDTPLYATAPENPTSVVIRLGCVAERAQLKPSVQIWTHSALPWLAELERVPGSPDQQSAHRNFKRPTKARRWKPRPARPAWLRQLDHGLGGSGAIRYASTFRVGLLRP